MRARKLTPEQAASSSAPLLTAVEPTIGSKVDARERTVEGFAYDPPPVKWQLTGKPFVPRPRLISETSRRTEADRRHHRRLLEREMAVALAASRTEQRPPRGERGGLHT